MPNFPTLEDVAYHSKSSRSTVSRVINNQPGVSPDTEQRIREAIHKLNYTPNQYARGLVTGNTGVLAVLAPSALMEGHDATPLALIGHMCKVANQKHYATMLCLIDNVWDSRQIHYQLINSHFIEGAIIAFCPDPEPLSDLLTAHRLLHIVEAYSREVDMLTRINHDIEGFTDRLKKRSKAGQQRN